MGSSLSVFARIWNKMFNNAEYKVIIVGLNAAGKTTTLYKLLLDEVVSTTPTVGSNLEEFVYRNIRLLMWDLGGQDLLRSTWNQYYINTQAVILVIDSTDRTRVPLIKEELFKMLAHENLKKSIILLFANKQDLKGAMSAAELTNLLSLHTIKDHPWHIQACCALTGEGLEQGMDWLVSNINKG
ncbi:ARF-like protein [Heterostelium album PN500]|uniref:ARF-like protein n=1 Tax=Heterostelium pallidum (strain ATCC 26659 / Pp 5 / PN500) TaxID=670386 RepID=D3AY70_HETP5|nr:ARF-like protein [Heterostelium album PN500]EFA85897.1 ARF-like protein [Heterostelium album PN500]|eukprot:XP_020438003.1 ARF-like protein [Heterostelium album PN500]